MWHCMLPKHLGRVCYNANSLPNKGSGAQGWAQKAVLWEKNKKKKTCPSDSDAPLLSKPDRHTGWSKMTWGWVREESSDQRLREPQNHRIMLPTAPFTPTFTCAFTTWNGRAGLSPPCPSEQPAVPPAQTEHPGQQPPPSDREKPQLLPSSPLPSRSQGPCAQWASSLQAPSM